MRGFDSSKCASKYKTELSIEKLDTFAAIRSHQDNIRDQRPTGEDVCGVAIIITGEGSTVGQQSKKIVEQKKINSMVVWNNVPRPVRMGTNSCLLRINISSSLQG